VAEHFARAAPVLVYFGRGGPVPVHFARAAPALLETSLRHQLVVIKEDGGKPSILGRHQQ
jgi:hypothetical protein